MSTINVKQLVDAFAGRKTIPLWAGEKLIAILEDANNEALRLIYDARVNFAWPIAGRILRERGEQL